MMHHVADLDRTMEHTVQLLKSDSLFRRSLCCADVGIDVESLPNSPSLLCALC